MAYVEERRYKPEAGACDTFLSALIHIEEGLQSSVKDGQFKKLVQSSKLNWKQLVIIFYR